MLNYIRLNNFRSYENEIITFTPGTNIIHGANGFGKSSILLAIGVALFDANRIPLKELVRYGQKEASIQVCFSMKDEYVVTRIFGHTSHYGIHKNSKLIMTGKEECTAFLTSLFGPLKSLWRYVIAVEQGDIYSLFELPETQRIDIFNHIFGIDDYKKAWSYLKDVKSEANGKLTSASHALDMIEVKLERQETIQEEIKHQEFKIEAVEKDIANIPVTKVPDNSEFIRMQNLQRKIDEARILYNERLVLEEELQLASINYRSYDLAVEEYNKAREEWLFKEGARKSALTQLKEEIALIEMGYCPTCKQPVKNFDLSKKKEDYKILSTPYILEATKPVDKYSATIAYAQQRLMNLPTLETVRKLEKQLKPIHFDEESYKEAEKQYQRKLELQERLKVYREQLDDLREELGQFKQLTDKKKVILETLHGYQSKIESIDSLREVFKLVAPLITSEIRRNVINEATRFVQDMFEDYYTVSLEWDETYNVSLNLDSQTISFSNLSTGQKTIVGLAIRIAINTLLSELPILILDEPTANLDANVRHKLANTLKGPNQMIIITHDDSFIGDSIIELSYESGKTCMLQPQT